MHPLPKIRNPPWISTLLFLTTWYSIRVVHRTIPGTCAAVATGTNFCGVHVVSGRTTTGRNRTLELWIGAWKSTPVPGTNTRYACCTGSSKRFACRLPESIPCKCKYGGADCMRGTAMLLYCTQPHRAAVPGYPRYCVCPRNHVALYSYSNSSLCLL